MNTLLHWRWPARLGGRVALALGLAGTALTVGLAGTALTGGLTDAAVAAGTHHTFSVVAQHEAVGWGWDKCGGLGNGTGISPQWTGISGLGGNVAQVWAGGCHSFAELSNGTVWAWGNDDWGEFGNGTVIDAPQTTPVQVTGLTGVTQVVAGIGHVLALRSDGTVWAWGDNIYGELGNGTTSYTPQTTPVQVPGLTNVVKIAAGSYFNLALRSDGTVWAWGENNYGQLGVGTTVGSPVPVQVFGLSRVTNIAAGGYTSLATRLSGLLGETTVWAWGDNGHGQLGDGTTSNQDVPQLVQGIGIPFGSGVAGIAVGNEYSLVLVSNGSVWGWGENEYGELGTTDFGQNVTSPVVEVAPGSGYTQISAGEDTNVALRSDGTAWAWGFNGGGELGDGTTTNSATPVQVTGLTRVTQVAEGGVFALAVHTVPLQFQP